MEFRLIEAIRERTARTRADVALGIGDDAALVDVPAGRQLVACTDTLVDGVHFLHGTDSADVGWKSLAVNLSDLAAMGAEPAWALLALTLPRADAGFVDGFADGFAELAYEYGVALVGGDTTQGPLVVTVTALGLVPPGVALTRSGARVGDAVFVTGTLGDAAGGLRLLRDSGLGTRDSDERGLPEGHAALLEKMRRPWPRVTTGLALRSIASSCIDVSDGLLADLGHVCAASGVGAEIDVDAVPVSSALRATFDDVGCRDLALTGGDDYELCFTAPAACPGDIARTFADLDLRVTRIGRIVAGSGVRALAADGSVVPVLRAGWEHFTR